MEGPSIVIATEEFKKFQKKLPLVEAYKDELLQTLEGKKFLGTYRWGKHLILHFSRVYLRIHFLMFGSYRIDKPRDNRISKLQLTFDNGTLYFYSCAIKEITAADLKNYDFSVDLMSEEWSPKGALASLKKYPEKMVCDLLMDQKIFSGLGNIMKNEILFRIRMHPETRIKQLTDARLKKLVKESEAYAWQFYEWKKQNVLKKNWLIMRKKKCPECGRAVVKKATGTGERLSHFCPFDQKKS